MRCSDIFNEMNKIFPEQVAKIVIFDNNSEQILPLNVCIKENVNNYKILPICIRQMYFSHIILYVKINKNDYYIKSIKNNSNLILTLTDLKSDRKEYLQDPENYILKFSDVFTKCKNLDRFILNSTNCKSIINVNQKKFKKFECGKSCVQFLMYLKQYERKYRNGI